MTGPAAPAQSPPTLIVLPNDNIQGEPKLSAVEQATRDAQARIDAGQPLIPADDQVRDPKTGQFKREPASDIVREVGTPRREAAPAAGQDTPAAETTPVEGETAPVAETAAEGEPEAEETPETEAPAAETVEDTGLSVVLPGRNKDETFAITVDSEETAERLRQLRNAGMRGEEIRAAREELDQRASHVADMMASIELDPVGHILQIAEVSPVIELQDGREVDVTEHLVLSLLTQPKLFAKLQPKIEAMLGDERELRTVRAEASADRQSIRAEMQAEAENRRVVQRNLQEVQAAVGALLPTSMPESVQQILFADCLRDLKAYADRNRLMTIQINDIPAILASRLVAHGVNPVEAAKRIAESATRRANSGPRRPAAPGAGARPPVAPRAAVPKNGKDHVASAARRTAVTVPPAGAGSPTGTGALTPPRKADGSKMSTEETLAWHRKELAKGIKRL